MKPSQRYLWISLAVGVIGGGLVAWFVPGLHWGVYTVVGVAVAAGGYNGLTRDAMQRKIIDKE